MTPTKPMIVFLVCLFAWSGSLAPDRALAVHEKEGGEWPWNMKLHGYHDREVAEALGGGWFMNVGPTGIRARITHDHPEYFTVKYVFKDSPAAGKIHIDDIIVGANGRKMTVAHRFGRRHITGWEGPMMEMAKLIEDSQANEGKLNLIVWPGGDESKQKVVELKIRAVGRFSRTWPMNCERSDRLFKELCNFLAAEYQRAGKFEKMTHTHSAATLALMTSDNRAHRAIVERIMSGYGQKRYDPTHEPGFMTWGMVHDSIVMGEWYLMTKDQSLRPAMQSLAECLDSSVWPTTGGLSHKPFAAIQRRMAAGGPKGYGAMAMPAGLGMIGLSLFKEAGLPHAEAGYQRLHQAYLSSVSNDGGIGYGFSSWDHAVIELQDETKPPINAPKGIGFECPEGMKGIGPFKIIWPTKADPRYRPTDWLQDEWKTNRVFDKGGNQRLVIRTMAPSEPRGPYRNTGKQVGHFGRSGVGALAHAIGNGNNRSWQYLSKHMANACANSYKGLMDGHASTHMHVLWGSLGAAQADRNSYRQYMDYIKWWFIMAECHDGGFVVMPGRDYASTDHVYATRNYPSAAAALILSVKDRRLHITGKASGARPTPASPTRPSADDTPRKPTKQPEGVRPMLPW